MTILFVVAFSAFFLEDNHLVTFEVGENFTNNFGTFNSGFTHFDLTIGVDQQYFFKFHHSATFGFQAVNIQPHASFGLELLSCDFYDCVHLVMRFKLYSGRWVACAAPLDDLTRIEVQK